MSQNNNKCTAIFFYFTPDLQNKTIKEYKHLSKIKKIKWIEVLIKLKYGGVSNTYKKILCVIKLSRWKLLKFYYNTLTVKRF